VLNKKKKHLWRLVSLKKAYYKNLIWGIKMEPVNSDKHSHKIPAVGMISLKIIIIKGLQHCWLKQKFQECLTSLSPTDRQQSTGQKKNLFITDISISSGVTRHLMSDTLQEPQTHTHHLAISISAVSTFLTGDSGWVYSTCAITFKY